MTSPGTACKVCDPMNPMAASYCRKHSDLTSVEVEKIRADHIYAHHRSALERMGGRVTDRGTHTHTIPTQPPTKVVDAPAPVPMEARTSVPLNVATTDHGNMDVTVHGYVAIRGSALAKNDPRDVDVVFGGVSAEFAMTLGKAWAMGRGIDPNKVNCCAYEDHKNPFPVTRTTQHPSGRVVLYEKGERVFGLQDPTLHVEWGELVERVMRAGGSLLALRQWQMAGRAEDEARHQLDSGTAEDGGDALVQAQEDAYSKRMTLVRGIWSDAPEGSSVEMALQHAGS